MEMLRVLRRKKVMWLVLAGVVAWIVLLFSISIVLFWSCEANSRYPGQCKKKRKMFMLLGALGFFPGPPHRCPIPLLDSPYTIHTPKLRKTGQYRLNLTYVTEEELNTTEKKVPSLFGGNQTWQQRDESFDIKSKMKVHCGFAGKTGAEISNNDQDYLKQCRFLVASGIFSGYDQPHQPSNISLLSQKVFCFIMVVDTKSLQTVGTGGYLTQDEMGNKWVGIWRLLELKNLPFDEPRRNGKVPKLLLHRLFPDTEYSIWIDGKLELVIDPLLILERYLWRGNHNFAIARHKHHRSVYDEAEANKRRKRYARPLIDKHMDVYRREGFQPWTEEKLPLLSDVPEGAIIIREHTPMTNLFSCLWFNEVNRFTPRDQLSFGYVVYKLKDQFPFFMFPNCEYNSLALLHKHMREHSSKVEWVKNLEELKEGNTMVETRGGIGLWTPANNLSVYESARNTSNLKRS